MVWKTIELWSLWLSHTLGGRVRTAVRQADLFAIKIRYLNG